MNVFMAINLLLIWMVLLLNFLLTLALIRRFSSDPRTKPSEILSVGVQAPEFELQDLYGSRITKSSFSGRALALVFVSPQCAPCKEHMPKLDALYPKAKRSGIELLVVSISDAEKTQLYVKELNFKSPVAFLPDHPKNTLPADYKLPGTPSYYLLDDRGKIQGGGLLDYGWEQITDAW
ncbi:MAG: redoxin domain-containing protein [Anaerolineae bacterium]|nr:redoxin domain-containing protein [Anaerolineae bacterium]